MYEDTNDWAPIVADRERSSTAPAVAYPCRGPYNRYLGCIGARKCRGTGVTLCVLGRWPDERPTSGRGGRPEADLPVVGRAQPAPARLPASPAPRPLVASPTPSTPEVGLTIGIVHDERRGWQQLSRHLTLASYQPVWLASTDAARAVLSGPDRPAALLVGSGVSTEAVMAAAAAAGVPVLSLPGSNRGASELDSAARMAVVWLTVTLRDRTQRAAG